MDITVYSKDSFCIQCEQTIKELDNQGIEYKVIKLNNPEALAMVKSLGHKQAPVVIAGEDHWSGFRPDKIDELSHASVI